LLVVTSYIAFSHLLSPFPCVLHAIEYVCPFQSPYQPSYVAALSKTRLSVCHFNLVETSPVHLLHERRPHRILGISSKITFASSPLNNTIQEQQVRMQACNYEWRTLAYGPSGIGYRTQGQNLQTGHPTSTQTGSWPYTTSGDSDFILVSVTDCFL
jgi:hypothetical protein